MTETYIVMKPVTVGTTALPSGSVVHPANWRNLGKLIEQRFLRPATEREIEASKKLKKKEAQNGS